MNTQNPDREDGSSGAELPRLTRRNVLGGLAAAGVLGVVSPRQADAASAPTTHAIPAAGAASEFAAAVSAPISGLVYITLDAFAFHVADLSSTVYRLYQDITGMQPQPASRPMYAPLPIPSGSVLKQINVAYQGQPIPKVIRRELGAANYTDLTTAVSLAAGGGIKTQTLAVSAELTLGASYAMYVYCSAGDSILGMEIGYIPPAQAFVPYTGSAPRVFDSRAGAAFVAGEERVIDLSSRLISTARAAVINLTATATGGGGFLSAFTDGIAWPGNSTVNFTSAGESVANGAVVTMTGGKIRVRCGQTSSHVIVDVIGSLL